jgi:hypothetical protein
MGEKVEENKKSMMFADDTVLFKTDEDIQLFIMHRFNIDAETLDCMPACKEPLQSLLWPEKKTITDSL